jgi:hypothetical protein
MVCRQKYNGKHIYIIKEGIVELLYEIPNINSHQDLRLSHLNNN